MPLGRSNPSGTEIVSSLGNRRSFKEEVALEMSLEGFIYADSGVRKDKKRVRGGKSSVEVGSR